MAVTLITPPAAPPISVPVMNPARRPTSFISNEAGRLATTTPIIIIATGRVARAGLGVSRCPTMPLRVMTVIAAIRNRAWLAARMATLRRSPEVAAMGSLVEQVGQRPGHGAAGTVRMVRT
jgi:hypothetical protein